MVIGLRTPDYGPLLPKMLEALDEANRANPHYLGWPRHSCPINCAVRCYPGQFQIEGKFQKADVRFREG